MPTCRSWKTGLEFQKWRPYKLRLLVSNSIYVKKDRIGPPSANQVTSKDELRCGHAVRTLRVHPPTSPVPPFLLTQNLLKSRGHCWKCTWHHEAESHTLIVHLHLQSTPHPPGGHWCHSCHIRWECPGNEATTHSLPSTFYCSSTQTHRFQPFLQELLREELLRRTL